MKSYFSLLMVLVASIPAYTQSIFKTKSIKTMETQNIISTVSAIFNGSDERNWSKVENSFAEQVVLDYTSMVGGEPSKMSPREITTAWKTILPGFDVTQHNLSAFKVTVDGNKATVTNEGHALHYITLNNKKEQWVVDGNYLFNLIKSGNRWQVTSMQFNKTSISGNLELPNIAQQRVKANEGSTKSIEFKSEGLIVKGLLHLPSNFNNIKKFKAVIVTGSWTTVKEQMPNLYAAKLAAQGVVALTFDFRNYGESEGEPRNYEVPQMKAQDIINAVSYLKTLPFVEKDEIGGLAICASSGYMIEAVAKGAEIKALTLVAPWLHNQNIVKEIYGGAEGVSHKIELSKKAKKQFAETGKVQYVPAISTTDSSAAMFGEFEYYLSNKRGAIKEWGNQFAVMAWQGWLEYDPIQFASQIHIPVLIVHSKTAAVPQGAEMFYNNLKGSKNIIWVDKAIQFDFYDGEPYTTNAAGEAMKWYNYYLN